MKYFINIILLMVFNIFILLLSGCATSANFKKMVNSWHDKSAQDLVHVWGYPSDIITAPDNLKVYEYDHSEIGYFHPENCNHGVCFPEQYIDKCTTFFKLNENDIIIQIEHRGAGCLSNESETLEEIKYHEWDLY
jgi:hypothetical protein